MRREVRQVADICVDDPPRHQADLDLRAWGVALKSARNPCADGSQLGTLVLMMSPSGVSGCLAIGGDLLMRGRDALSDRYPPGYRHSDASNLVAWAESCACAASCCGWLILARTPYTELCVAGTGAGMTLLAPPSFCMVNRLRRLRHRDDRRRALV